MTQRELIDFCTARDVNLPCRTCEMTDECDRFMRKTNDWPYQGKTFSPELYTDDVIEGYDE